MKCRWTNKTCDPEDYYCHYLDRLFKRTQNKTCGHIISNGDIENED